MRKLILSVAVVSAMTSTSAFAFDLYEKDDFKFQLDGEYTIQFQQDPGNNESFDVVFDDLELEFKGEYEINNYITAFGRIDVEWEDGSSDLEDAFVGLKTGALSTSLGNQDWGSDDFGVEKAFEFDAGTSFLETGGNDTIKFDYDAGNYRAVLSYDLAEEGDFGEDDSSAIDLYLSTSIGNLDLEFVYQDVEADDEVIRDVNGNFIRVEDVDSLDTFGLSAAVDLGQSNIGIDYSSNDITDTVNIAADYSFGKTTVAVGLTRVEFDDSVLDDETHVYLNGRYDLHKKVNLFAETGKEVDDADLGFAIGMEFQF